MTHNTVSISQSEAHLPKGGTFAALLTGFAPFLLFAVLTRVLNAQAGLMAGALLSLLVLADERFRKKRSPGVLESGTFLLFGSLAGASLISGTEWSILETRLFVDAGLFGIVLTTIVLGRPFTLQYSQQSGDSAEAGHPRFLRTHRIVTGVWAAAFASLATIDFALMKMPAMPVKIGIGATVLVLWGAARFSTWYPERIRASFRPGRGTVAIAALAVCFLAPGTMWSEQVASNNAGGCGSAGSGQPGVQCVQLLTGAEPGATDPMGVPAGRYSLFPVQDVGAMFPSLAGVKTQLFKTQSNKMTGDAQTLKAIPWNPTGTGPVQQFAVTGRILSSDHDDFVTATRVGNPTEAGQVAIQFLDQGFSTNLSAPLLPRESQTSDSIAIAQGDLDRSGDSQGNSHSEVVVAHISGKTTSGDNTYYRYNIDVLNYSSGNVSSPEITHADFADQGPKFNSSPASGVQNTLPSDNIFSISIGDFDGDGRNEIALVAFGRDTLLLYTYRYETVNGAHTLRQVNSHYWPLSNIANPADQQGMSYVGTVTSAAGDFDGDGAAELAVAYGKWGIPPGKNAGQYGFILPIVKYDKNLRPELKNVQTTGLIGGISNKNFDYITRPTFQLVSGQFLLNPPNIKYGRQQFVLAFNDTGNAPGSDANPSHLGFLAYSASNDLQAVTQFGSLNMKPMWVSSSNVKIFSVSAGGFSGNWGTGIPTASLAVTLWSGNPNAFPTTTAASISSYEIDTIGVGSGGSGIEPLSRRNYLLMDLAVDLRAKLPVLSYDRQGNSMDLGEPVHMTLFQSPKLSYILQEPPKHLYWDETTKKPVNFTRMDGNNVSFSNSQTTSLLNESKNETSRTVGESTAVSAQATVSAGGSFLVASAEAAVTAGVKTGTAYDYNEHKEQYDSNYFEKTTGSMGNTERDDLLIGRLASYDIWRYRIFGAKNNNNLSAFYEIVMPGSETTTFGAGGKNFDWYQPIHENGNILSYPSRLGASSAYLPFDMGEFSFTPNGQKLSKPLVEAKMESFDGTAGNSTLQFSNDVAQSGQVNYSHTLSENQEIFGSVTAKASFWKVGVETSIDASAEVHTQSSWGGTATSTETTKTQTNIALNRVSGQSNAAYPFFPVLYNTTDGTMKMTYAVPDPAGDSNYGGNQTYRELYGGHPDPALNLPFRFYGTAAGWVPDLSATRKQMRGLFLRTAEKNAVSGTYDAVSRSVKKGEKVRIEPRVYNYSTGWTAQNVIVQFQVIPYDGGSNSEVCANPVNAAPGKVTGLICPQPERTVIGQTRITELLPRHFTCIDGKDNPAVTDCATPVFIDWDTTQFGPGSPGSTEYRIYVVLNPGGSGGTEIYPEEPAPVSVAGVSADQDGFSITANSQHFKKGDYVILGGLTGTQVPNGIVQVADLTAGGFRVGACEPSPPCSPLPSSGLLNYTGGGTATLLDPGQNNEGYRKIIITNPGDGSSAAAAGNAPVDYLQPTSLQAVNEAAADGLQAQSVTAYLDGPIDLRFTAFSNQVHTDAAHMLLYDGDPLQGGTLIADKFVHPGAHATAGESVWVQYIPTQAGVHHLHAVLVDGPGKSQPVSQLEVTVLPRSGGA